jgi:hypothetical protein
MRITKMGKPWWIGVVVKCNDGANGCGTEFMLEKEDVEKIQIIKEGTDTYVSINCPQCGRQCSTRK